MNILNTNINGVIIIEPNIFNDSRGFFIELWNAKTFTKATGLDVIFVQDNHSRSAKNVLRGLGYQIIRPQGKLVSVVQGSICDIVVDLRRGSPSFGTWLSVDLTEFNHRSLWIPPGCAHGFVVRSEYADLCFKVTDYYSPEHDRCIVWNDPDLAIDWGLTSKPIVSAKDLAGVAFKDAEIYL